MNLMTMADLLFGAAALDGRSMSFSASRAPFLAGRKCPKAPNRNGISASKLQSSTKIKVSCSISAYDSSPSASSDSVSGNFDLLSITECHDGSIVFSFGSVSEMERSVEAEESAATCEGVEEDGMVASGVLLKDDMANGDLVASEIVDEELDHTLEGEVKSHQTRGKGNDSAELVDVPKVGTGKLEVGIAFDSHSDVMKTEEHSNEGSVQKDTKQIFSSAIGSKGDNCVKAENNNASKVNPVHSGEKNDCTILTITELPSDGQNVSAFSEVFQRNSHNETLLPSSRPDFKTIPNAYPCLEGTEENTTVEVTLPSSAADEHNLDAQMNNVMDEDANEKDMIEGMPTSTLSKTEPILNKEETRNTVNKSVDTKKAGSPKMPNESVPSSTWKDDEISGEIESSDIAQESASSLMELQLIGTTAMREKMSAKGFSLSSGATLLRQPSEALAGGEDAYFVAGGNWLGVADGVGEWSLEGINDGLYAQELLKNSEKIVLDCKSIPVTEPIEVLARSVAATQSPGSSTILIAYFDNQALHVANIGDSGFIIIRHSTVLKRSSPMVHEFNLPLQIKRGDNPRDFVEVYHVDLDEDDVVITATDGLFDNIYEQEIVSIVTRSLQEGLKLQEIAELLARRAQEIGSSLSARSPFADAAQAAGYVGYRGGKLDDVAVIVSLVQKKESSESK